VLVTLGADPLGTQLSPVEHARDYWTRRRPEMGPMSRLIAIESIVTLTGSNADERLRVRPDHLYPVAMAIARTISSSRVRGPPSRRISRPFGGSRRPRSSARAELRAGDDRPSRGSPLGSARQELVMAGPHAAPAAHARFRSRWRPTCSTQHPRNDGVTVDASTPLAAGPRVRGDRDSASSSGCAPARSAALIIHGVNPVYSLPAAFGFAEALKRVPFVASLSDRADETSLLADVIAPVTHYLESWDDHEPRTGVLSLTQPAIAPLYDVRPFQETLLVWGRVVRRRAARGHVGTWHERLSRALAHGGSIRARTPRPRSSSSGRDRSAPAWCRSRRTALPARAGSRARALASMPPMPPDGPKDQLQLVLYQPISVGDGRFANNAWLQELPDPVSKICWDNYAALSPAAREGARGVGVRAARGRDHGSTVGHAKLELPVHVQPGLHDDVIGVALGYGRTAAGRVGNRVGPERLRASPPRRGAGWASVGSRRAPRALAGSRRSRWCRSIHQSEHRPIVYDTTYGAFLRDPHSGIEEEEHLPSMWTPYRVQGLQVGDWRSISAPASDAARA
jgi:molybdopterin-containing oxidoreductase family iron-sulfur binding subunit